MNKEQKQGELKQLVVYDESMKVQNNINCKDADLRFDGITRVVALDSRKLLVMLEKGQIVEITIIFDQAEIDVADAIFTPVKCTESVLPSSVS